MPAGPPMLAMKSRAIGSMKNAANSTMNGMASNASLASLVSRMVSPSSGLEGRALAALCKIALDERVLDLGHLAEVDARGALVVGIGQEACLCFSGRSLCANRPDVGVGEHSLAFVGQEEVQD